MTERWWNTTWTPQVPAGVICIAVVTDDGRKVPALVEPDPGNANRARVILPNDPFPGGPFGATVTVRADGWEGAARWTLPAYGEVNREAETPLKLEPSVAPFPPADLIAPDIRPFDTTDGQGNLVHTVLPPEALAVAYPPVRDVDYPRGDFGGVTTPLAPPFVPGANTTPPNMWMTYLLPLYVGLRMPNGDDCVDYFLAWYLRLGYTHLHLARIDSAIGGLLDVAQRAKRLGLFVTYWAALSSDSRMSGWNDYDAVALPALEALVDAKAVDIPIVGGEVNRIMDPEPLISIVTQLGVWLRSHGVTRLGLHFTSNYGSYEPSGADRAAWWRQMASLGVTHLCWQADPNQTAGMMGAMLYEARLYVRDCGVKVVAFETIAENQLYGRASETDGRRIGWELACTTRLDPSFPPVYGAMNGLPLADANGNPVIV